MRSYPPTSDCAVCRGKCCRHYPGIPLPSDFKKEQLTVEGIVGLVKSGDWSIDWWEGDPRPRGKLSSSFFLRPRTDDKRDNGVYGLWYGRCLFLREDGCRLAFKERPSMCRALKPNLKGEDCRCSLDKRKIVIAWMPYNKVIGEAEKFYETEM
jgi:Fe-S-cluster containining protein